MFEWLQAAIVAACIVAFVLIIVIIKRCFCSNRKRREILGGNEETVPQRLESGTAKLHHVSLHHLDRDGSKRTNYYVFRRGLSTRPFFNWADHPSLVTDAVENGWSRFAFTTFTPSPSARSTRSLLGPCATGDHDRQMEVEISWEVCQGSADFLQKIRLHSGLKKIPNTAINSSMVAKSAIRTALPLPGPPLGNSAFPQEAYFEIIILPFGEDQNDVVGKAKGGRLDGDKIKLIQEDFNAKVSPETLINFPSGHGNGNSKLEEMKLAGKQDGKTGAAVLSIGLAGGGPLPLKLPGSYPGSIGFNSNGSIFLDGVKLVFESEREEWGRADTVIGCGYNPSQKKVFFTVDSQLVHEIHCKSEEFGTPLYPTLAANSDITVLVNLGQCAFKYSQANLQRTPNPCFIGPLANSPVLGYEDSRELFSMGRIDAQWLNRSTTRSTSTPGNNMNRGVEFDEESEGDLFEIVLDSYGKSPITNTS
ncbi:uncharacterized protein [Coffea arabica]|uniref:SPRY domain-containing protein n=1 Tax=Coffea arabica TaxID=13443 RepID=A0A6P6US26_COFAR|nr:uncharacterized protein LOC113713774 [Coffea arabica]